MQANTYIEETLYQEILAKMPIPCVDLIIENSKGEILMLKRNNEPAKNQWWTPGGRVLLGETLREAALRKAQEEAGLSLKNLRKWTAYDIILPLPDNKISHAVSTFFVAQADSLEVNLDTQSEDFDWQSPEKWLNLLNFNPILKEILINYIASR